MKATQIFSNPVTIKGNLIVTGNTSLQSLSATTFISGSTNLYDIFLTSADGNDISRVQPGTNIFTGGSANAPTVNLTAATLTGQLVLMQGTNDIAPLKFQSGDLLTATEAGTMEYQTDDLYFNISTNVPGTTYTSRYPSPNDITTVKAYTYYDGYCPAWWATDPLLSVVGDYIGNSWKSPYAGSPVRFHMDLGSPKTITRIYYENFHRSGLDTQNGVKSFTFWGSNSPTAFAAYTNYSDDTDWTELTVDTNEMLQHVAADVADPQYVYVSNVTAYRYYAFKFSTWWGAGGNPDHMGIRRIELQDSLPSSRRGIILNDGENLTSGVLPVATTNGRVIDSIISSTSATTTIYGNLVANGDLTISGDTNIQGLSASSFSSDTFTYRGQEMDDRFVNVTGDTMTGSLTLMEGTTTSVPLRFKSGDLLSVTEPGVVEYKNDDYYASIITPPPGISYTDYYPPVQNQTYVNSSSFINATWAPWIPTNPSNTLTGGTDPCTWLTNGVISDVTFHIDLGSSILIDRVYYENVHYSGILTEAGARDFTLWGSNEASAFSNVAYSADTNWTQITTDVSSFEEHVALDVADPKYIYLTNSTLYRYYRFKIVNNYGHGSYIGLRRLQLQYGAINYRKGIVLNDGTNLTSGVLPVATTNGRVIDSIISSTSATTTINGNFNVTGNTSLQSLSASTYISGTTNLYDIFSTPASSGSLYVYKSGDTITGDLIIQGNLTVNGPVISASTEHVLISDNLLTLNYLSGRTDISGVTRGTSGIEIDRGAYPNYYFLYNENSDDFRIGQSAGTDDTQAVATREDSPTSNGFAYWNASEYRFDTTTSLSANSLIVSSISASTLTAATVNITSFTSATETIVTTSGTSLLQNYLMVDSKFITDTTVLFDLLSASKWCGKIYTGTTVGLVEGQEYVGTDYRYIYQNSTVTRYEMADKNISIYTGTTTILSNESIVEADSVSDITLNLAHPSACTKTNITIKNISTGIVTLSATTLIDGASTQILTYMDSYDLYHNYSTYFIK